MKKIILFSAAMAMLATTFMSCKKDSPAPVVTMPVQTSFVKTLLTGQTIETVNLTYELGVTFKSSVKGNIKSLKVNVPQTGNYRVTLWKVSDHSIVATNTVTCTTINSWNNTLAVNIPIEADTEYILSTNCTKYYRFSAPAGTFPYTHGYVTLINYRGNSGLSQTFPASAYGALCYGFVDFNFQRSL